MANLTHYAVVAFDGDFDGTHPDPELRGQHPQLQLIACGPADFCWDSVAGWTRTHPLRDGERVEVLARDPAVTSRG